MSLVWGLLTKVARSVSHLTLIPSSLSSHDQQPHVCHNPALDPNTLAVAQWTYRMVDRRYLSLPADLGQHHVRPGMRMSLSARLSDFP
jgi:hypothetical protein